MSVLQSDQRANTLHSDPATAPSSGEAPIPPIWGAKRRFWVLPLIVIGAIGTLAVGWSMLMGGSTKAPDTMVYYTVRRGTLPITVTERGNMESQNTEEIICEVENFGGDRSGVTGTQILFIVANGCSVKKGDLLVELDSAPLKERLDTQFLSLQRAEAENIQAKSKYDNQETQNETNLAEAELRVLLTKLAMESYEDETGGTYQIELQNIEMGIQTARAQQMIAKTDCAAMELLFKLGYKSKGDWEAAKLTQLKANSSLASELSKSRQLQNYTHEMEKLDRQGKFDTAKRSRTQVERNNKSELAQAQATRDSAKRAYEKEQERYDRYKEQLEKCKIYAPQDGMVAYAMEGGRRGGGSVIEEGAFVRQRQKILTIPDLSSMQVSTSVHESVLDQVHKGLKAVIRVDAFPERSYQGSVKTVAVLPDQGGWLASDTKVYKTIVTIDEEVKRLKPGMTAVVEIDIEQLRDVISVPIQAIVQRGKSNWCYVNEQGKLVRRKVALGKTNDKFVEVKKGLVDGESVVLNPTNLVDESESKTNKEEKDEAEPEKQDTKKPRQGKQNQRKQGQSKKGKGMRGKGNKRGNTAIDRTGPSASGKVPVDDAAAHKGTAHKETAGKETGSGAGATRPGGQRRIDKKGQTDKAGDATSSRSDGGSSAGKTPGPAIDGANPV